MTRFADVANEVFNLRPIAPAPGGLEPIARFVEVAAYLCRIEPILSP